jgi:hypothetical protein
LDSIVEYKGTEAKRKIRELLASSAGNPLTAALCGYIFEPYAVEMRENGGEFKCRMLVHGNKKAKPNETTLKIRKGLLIKFHRIKLPIGYTYQKLKTMQHLMLGFLELVHFK